MTRDKDPLIERLAAANPVRRPASAKRSDTKRRRGVRRRPLRASAIALSAVLGVATIALGYGVILGSPNARHSAGGGVAGPVGPAAGHWRNVSYEIGNPESDLKAKAQVTGAVDPKAQELPKPGNALYGTLLDGVSCVSANECVGVGYFEDTSHNEGPLSEQWNGSTWTLGEPVTPAGAKSNALLEGVSCGAPESCIAVGHYVNSSGETQALAEQWDGTKWALEEPTVPSGAKASWLFGISCVAAKSCEAVGMFTNSSGATVPLAETWNGTWSVQEPPAVEESASNLTKLTGVSCVAESECFAVGYSFSSSGYKTVAEIWDGKEWKILPTPALSESEADGITELEAVSCRSSEECMAVGWFGGNHGQPLAEHWNGKEWKIEHVPVSSEASASIPASIRLDGVSCPAAQDCFAVGGFENKGQGSQTVPFSAHWTGSWSSEEPPVPSTSVLSRLYGISCWGSHECMGVGKLGDPPDPGKGMPNYTPLAEQFE